MSKLDIAYSGFRSGMYAVVLYVDKEKIYYHFASMEQARRAILKVSNLRSIEEIHKALKKLSGDDYFWPSEEASRNWESWKKSMGTQSSSSSSSDQSNSSE